MEHQNVLEQLKTMTVVVADTGDILSIKQFQPRDTTTNPSLITAAAANPTYAPIINEALRWARERAPKSSPTRVVAAHAVDRLAVEFGLRILDLVPGRVSTEVDARLSFDTDATVTKARELITMYEAAGARRERILIKIASTWEGIAAARALEQQGIHCNLTLLFGMHQAVACADAKVTLISPFVGRILDWHKKTHGRDFLPHEDPGVLSVSKIYAYYKHFEIQTEVMGASFRNIGEITELAGCDLLTIAPVLLDELRQSHEVLERKLDAPRAKAMALERITMNETRFRAMHEEDAMSREKLAEGIAGFSNALESLEQTLVARL